MKLRLAMTAALAAALLLGCSENDDALVGDVACVHLDVGAAGGVPWLGPGTSSSDHVIRTDAEYDAVFPGDCRSVPCGWPPRPAAGQALLVARRAWSGCGSCTTILCVTRGDGTLVADVRTQHGHPDCDALGVAAGWALIEDEGLAVVFATGADLPPDQPCD